MSRGVNCIHLVGNVGQDPEIRETKTGTAVANFSLATGRQWKDKNGKNEERTEWHRCVVWNIGEKGLVDIVEQYVKKGDRLYVRGELRYNKWEDEDGNERTTAEIFVQELTLMASGKREDDEDERPKRSSGTSSGTSNRGSKTSRTKTGNTSKSSTRKKAAEPTEDEDDDLPF